MIRFVRGMGSQSLARNTPFLIYGTAWKKEETGRLVGEAIRAGFRHIDTACQPRHYFEPGVGAGWTAVAKELGLERGDLYLQTKYTSIGGQDRTSVPYDATAPLETQVRQSVQCSLRNLRTTYLDALVLHSPLRRAADTLRVWREMEAAVDAGSVSSLGVSNCYSMGQFKALYDEARIKPVVLQNRFYADSNFDHGLREFCSENGILYQSFWTLTASVDALNSKAFQKLALEKNLTPATLMYAFMMSYDYITPLCGTTDKSHMQQDIDVMRRMKEGELVLTNDERSSIADMLGVPGI